MKFASVMIGWMVAASGLLAGGADLLRFSEGDQLRGTFEGIGAGGEVNWRRDDVAAPVAFKAGGVRHVVFRDGKASPLKTLSHLGLANGDRLPGEIKSIDADAVVLDTPYAGELRVPRDAVALLAPNPLGGRLHYHGPFAEDEWKLLKAESSTDPAADGKAASKPGSWVYSGAAWYWEGERGGGALYRESCMPPRSVLKFDLAWKSRLGLTLGFHLDFSKSEADEQKPAVQRFAADLADFARFCGNGYILQVYPNYVMLYRCDVSKEGKPRLERFQSGNLSARMGDSGRTNIEIRSHPERGAFMLFINGEFAMQWSEAEIDKADASSRGFGNGLAFAANGENLSMRISDITISEWNGVPDSARSMESEDQDVVLMCDGVDRYSGKLGTLDENGKLVLEAKHGTFAFPIKDVAEIRFAKNRMARKEDDGSSASMVVRLWPIGSISGRPVSGNREKIQLKHDMLGVIEMSLESVVMLDFDGKRHIVDDWNDEF